MSTWTSVQIETVKAETVKNRVSCSPFPVEDVTTNPEKIEAVKQWPVPSKKPGGGGELWISSDGDDRRIFLGLKFSISGLFWVSKFGKYFFG